MARPHDAEVAAVPEAALVVASWAAGADIAPGSDGSGAVEVEAAVDLGGHWAAQALHTAAQDAPEAGSVSCKEPQGEPVAAEAEAAVDSGGHWAAQALHMAVQDVPEAGLA